MEPAEDPLIALRRELERVLTADAGRPGRVIGLDGRRRVGKSRLAQRFVSDSDLPYVYFTATPGGWHDELARFAASVRESALPDRAEFPLENDGSWATSLADLARLIPATGAVIVIDELGVLQAHNERFDAELKRAFDRYLASKRALVLLVGGEAAEWPRIVMPPLNPAEVASLLRLDAADGIDAWLVSGGLPGVLVDWPEGLTPLKYVARAIENPHSSLVVTAERWLAAEFGAEAQARSVLGIVGQGRRTFSAIGRAATGLQQASLNRALGLLTDRELVSSDVPLSTRPAPREKRYQVADPYLSFWLRFLGPFIGELERGRADHVMRRVRDGFEQWRSLAIEPLAREALSRLVVDPDTGADPYVGGFWTRAERPRVEIVLADQGPTAERILGVGAVKWGSEPFTERDVADLRDRRRQLPGAAQAPMLAVARAGSLADGVDAFPPEDLLAGWPS